MTALALVTREELVSDPIGRCSAGPHHLVWCVDPELTGVSLWGRPDAEELADLLALLARPHHPRLRVACDTVFDGARLEGVDACAFDAFVRGALEHRAAIEGRTRRQALVRPSGLAGALLAGFNAVLGLAYDWRVFDSLRAALGWLGRPDADAVDLALTGVVEATVHGSPLVARVRALLRSRRDRASIADAARSLGVSVRSLQRRLAEQGTSFRSLVDDACMDRAEALLLDTDLKIESIAEEVGCKSGGDFIKLFRRRHAKSPGEWRKERRGA